MTVPNLDPADHAGRFEGRDVYVLGSGPSLNDFPPKYFEGKIVVSTNHGCTFAGITPTYLVTKYHRHAWEYALAWPRIPTVVTRHDLGNHHAPALPDGTPFIVVDHNHNVDGDWEPSMFPDPPRFVATWSTITTAMHWAAHLVGDGNVILLGHDCGQIDAAGRIPGYREASSGPVDPHGDSGDAHLWQAFDAQSRLVKAELVRRYDCTVTSVSPYINGNMEGHSWRSFAGTLNG